MDVVVTDLLSATSSAASDGIVRPARSASFSGPAIRKNFSSVLQGVRGEEKKGSTQEPDSPRGSDKVEDRPGPKQSKDLNSATSQTEGSEATQARTLDSGTLNDGQTQTIDSSREVSESALPQSHAGSSAEEQMMISGVHEAHDGLQVSDCDCRSGAASSPGPVVTDASVWPTENRPLEKGTAGAPPAVPEQAKDASLFQKGVESQVKQSTELGGSEGENDAQGKASDSAKTQAAIQASLSGGTVSSSDQHVAQVVQAQDGKLLQESQFDQNLVALDRGENSVAHQSTDKQAQLLVPAHDDQGESFGQSGHDHDSRQQGDPEPKLVQGTVVDLQSMNGRTTEHYAAVAQSQTVSVPPAPSPTVVVPSAQPVPQIADVAQQPIASLLRSVVVDVAQPDLGHVNIRVAMMNDSVHAHFSTDRAEIGQFLINGQDRLQATLQASGLDMGQFRVDIDRQNGGRSFQQGLFQEQGQSGHQGFQGVAKEQAQGRSDDMYRPIQGRLNLVA